MFSIKPFCFLECNKELAAVCAWSTVGHRKKTSLSVRCFEIFVIKFISINRFSTSSIFISEITSLKHEILDESMENAVLKVQRLSRFPSTFLSCAKCTEVFCCFRYNILVEFEFNSLRCILTDLNVKEYNWVRGIAKVVSSDFGIFIVTFPKESTPHLLLFGVHFFLFGYKSLECCNYFSIGRVKLLSVKQINFSFI